MELTFEVGVLKTDKERLNNKLYAKCMELATIQGQSKLYGAYLARMVEAEAKNPSGKDDLDCLKTCFKIYNQVMK